MCGLIPIYILGLGAPQSVQGTMIATLLMLLVTFWGFFMHANVRWRFGPLEWLIATPAFHLWHLAFRSARPQLRLDAPVLGLAVRDKLPAGRIADRLRDR